MKINEIFQSINGEITAWHQGSLTTFIRMAGCNLNCSYCDAKYANEVNYNFSVDEVTDIIAKTGCKQVTITGGEPTLQTEELFSLMRQLINRLHCKITVETNGTYDIPITWTYDKDVSWVVDYKFAYPDKMAKNILSRCYGNNWLKFVIAQEEDLITMMKMFETKYTVRTGNIAVGTTGKVPAAKIVDFLIGNKLFNCVVNHQIHKQIWPRKAEGLKLF